MVWKTRKHEPLLTPEQVANRNAKHPVSTEPAVSGKGIPVIPPREWVSGKKSSTIPSRGKNSGGNSRE